MSPAERIEDALAGGAPGAPPIREKNSTLLNRVSARCEESCWSLLESTPEIVIGVFTAV